MWGIKARNAARDAGLFVVRVRRPGVSIHGHVIEIGPDATPDLVMTEVCRYEVVVLGGLTSEALVRELVESRGYRYSSETPRSGLYAAVSA